jgi:hypothetical protein
MSDNNVSFEVEASQAVTYVKPEITTKFGTIAIIGLIAKVLPILIQSYGAINSASAQSYLASHYDSEEDSFGDNLERHAMIATRRANRHNPNGLMMSREEAYDIGKASLKHAMNAQESSVTACFALADTLVIPEE